METFILRLNHQWANIPTFLGMRGLRLVKARYVWINGEQYTKVWAVKL